VQTEPGVEKPETKRYLVTWRIDVTAESPLAAAWWAWGTVRGPGSTATVFEVEEWTEPRVTVDLSEQKCGRCGAELHLDPDGDEWLDTARRSTCSPHEDDSPDHWPAELLSRWPS